MEGGPKTPERHASQEVQDFVMYVSVLPLTMEEKNLLVSLVALKELGRLTIFVDHAVVGEAMIDPTKTDKELTEELSSTFDTIIEGALNKTSSEPLPFNPQIAMNIVFEPFTPDQMQ
jgi:hypothetical protein